MGAYRRKDPYGLERLSLILLPTYPSSGSEYGLGAVAVDPQSGVFGTAFGIAVDHAILVPGYSLSTEYTGLVTLVQLSASMLGDQNPISCDAGISVIRNVQKAARRLMNHPDDLNARGSDPVWRLHRHLRPAGIGKEENYSYDIYEVEFIPEALLGVSYRKSLTTLFPRFLNVMADAHGADIRRYLEDAFGYTGDLVTSTDRLIDLFSELGADMYFDGEVKEEQVRSLPVESQLSMDQRIRMIRACMCNQGEYALRS